MTTPVPTLRWRHSSGTWTCTAEGERYAIDQTAGRWRLSVLKPGLFGGPKAWTALWEADSREACAEMAAFQVAERRAEAAWLRLAVPAQVRATHLPGVTLAVAKRAGNAYCEVVVGRDGEEVGSLKVTLSPWTATYITGQRSINGSSRLDECVRHKGVGRLMYDLVEGVCGLPMVPHGRNGTPGSLSQTAQAFWAKRATHRPVPGFNDPGVEARERALQAGTGYLHDEKHKHGRLGLGIALGERTGWPVEAACFVEEDGRRTLAGAWCVMPDGRALSSRGPEPREFLTSKYEGGHRAVEYIVTTADDLHQRELRAWREHLRPHGREAEAEEAVERNVANERPMAAAVLARYRVPRPEAAMDRATAVPIPRR